MRLEELQRRLESADRQRLLLRRATLERARWARASWERGEMNLTDPTAVALDIA
jgi:hypothetical protein